MQRLDSGVQGYRTRNPDSELPYSERVQNLPLHLRVHNCISDTPPAIPAGPQCSFGIQGQGPRRRPAPPRSAQQHCLARRSPPHMRSSREPPCSTSHLRYSRLRLLRRTSCCSSAGAHAGTVHIRRCTPHFGTPGLQRQRTQRGPREPEILALPSTAWQQLYFNSLLISGSVA